MNRVFCSFTDTEYEVIKEKAGKLGISISRLCELATTMYVDLPRKETTNVTDIRQKIMDYINSVKDETFFCASPFEEWAQMTTAAKRTAAYIMKELANTGVIEKVEPSVRSHQANIYRKPRDSDD